MTPVILVPIMAHVIQSEYTTISLMALVSMADFVALNNQCIHLSNREECSAKGGTNDGSCASGYGVCCTCKYSQLTPKNPELDHCTVGKMLTF